MVIKNESVKIPSWHIFYQYFSCLSALLAIVSNGVHYGWTSPSLPKLLEPDSPIPITEEEGFWLVSMPLIGAILGSITVVPIVDFIGRHKTILLTCVPYSTACILIYFSTTLLLLHIARFIAGIADGWSFAAVAMYIGEISDPKRRGMFASWMCVAYIFGILLVNIVGSYLSIKATALILIVIPIASLLTFIWMPESPYFHIMKGNLEASRKCLEKFRGLEVAGSELIRIDQAVKADLIKAKTNPFDLFTVKRNRRAIIVMMLCRGTQQFSGSATITFYAQNIFTEAGSVLSAELASIIFFSIQLIVTTISSSIVDKTGRRPLLIISVAGSGLMLFIQGVYFYLKTNTAIDLSSFTLVPLIALVSFIILFSLGLQGIPLLIISEIFNQDIKAVAMCFSDIYFDIIVTITSKYFQVTRDTFGMFVPFISFAIVCFVALGFIAVSVPETTGKTLEDIQDYFRATKRNKTDSISI